MEMTDSSSQSDDTSGGGGSSNGGSARPSSRARNSLTGSTQSRRRKGVLNAKERNLRRLESNERERMRMHSLNDAFQVMSAMQCVCFHASIYFMLNFVSTYVF